MRRTSRFRRRTEGILLAIAVAAFAFTAAAFAAEATVKGRIRTPDSGVEARSRLTNTVVQIRPAAGVDAPKRLEAATRVIEARHGRFVPAVVAIPIGGTVELMNRDEHIHNVVSSSPAKEFDLGMQAPGESGKVVFDRAGIVQLRCKAEPPMKAFVVVTDTPYFAVTDRAGAYEIHGLPPGSFQLRAWNPHYKPLTKRLSITREHEVLQIDFRFEERRLVPRP